MNKDTVPAALPMWRHWAQTTPFSQALKLPACSLTWQQLAQVVDSYAGFLAEQGVTSDEVVTLIGKNRAESVLLCLAAQQLGALVAFVMPAPAKVLTAKLNALYRPEQRRFIYCTALGDCPEVDVQQDWAQLPRFHPQLLHMAASDTEPMAYHSSRLASVLFTSGSTGAAKAVAHTHAQHFASAQGLLQEFSFTSQDCWLLSLPLYHVAGVAIVYRWLLAGATLKIGQGRLADDILSVTHASLVATQLKRLLDTNTSLSLTHVLLGGSHVEHSLATRAQQQGIETWLGYGMTEAASTVTAKAIDGMSNAGHVLKNRQVKLVDGRIYIAGQTLAQGYYYQGALTPLTDEQGWFDSKDLGEWQDEELRIVGRADNLFISGGENIHCEEIESALCEHAEIADAIVVPIVDAEFGHRPVAVLQSTALFAKPIYDAHLMGKLEKFKWPVAYYLLPDSLQSGAIKPARHEIKQWLAQTLAEGHLAN
ncbi:o-succinylbenzoate--CoA ligase [Vibrio navarrensis]